MCRFVVVLLHLWLLNLERRFWQLTLTVLKRFQDLSAGILCSFAGFMTVSCSAVRNGHCIDCVYGNFLGERQEEASILWLSALYWLIVTFTPQKSRTKGTTQVFGLSEAVSEVCDNFQSSLFCVCFMQDGAQSVWRRATGWKSGSNSRQSQDTFLYSGSTPTPGPYQPPVQWVTRSRIVYMYFHSHIRPHGMCLIKHKNNFIFFFAFLFVGQLVMIVNSQYETVKHNTHEERIFEEDCRKLNSVMHF